MDISYQIFGSHDSRDCDVIVFVDSIGSVAESRDTIELLKRALQPTFDKEVNVNLAVERSGRLVEVFKGTVDEVNNSLMFTYDLHPQKFPQRITQLLPRDAGLKSLRSMRAVLSFMSRTQHRAAIKKALGGTATEKYNLLRHITIADVTDLGTKNTDLVDFHKTLAFQMGQSYLLNTGVEVYTKQQIAESFPPLAPFLARKGGDVIALEFFKHHWLNSFDPALIPEFEDLRR